MLIALYTCSVFLSAFLLFQIEPVIAKMILPWFGGSSAVWSVCLLFFQVGLLGGYAYAHGIARRLSRRAQAAVHSVLLVSSLLVLPVIPGMHWKMEAEGHPQLRILLMLTFTIGLPYFLLSATSPLIQSWYSRSHRGAIPYRLFSLSNLASLAALFSYPFVVEPYITIRTQAISWSWGYAAFVVLCAATAWWGVRPAGSSAEVRPAAHEETPSPAGRLRMLWVLLAACPSILLLSVTTYLTQDVASIPFLWILPMAVYLLSFVLCFESGRFYRRRLFLQLCGIALVATGYLLAQSKSMPNVFFTVGFLNAALFVWCMICHGELARLKPDPSHLTTFYLMLSVGGAAGGIFVGLVAPAVFNGYYEFPTGMALAGVLIAAVLWREGKLRIPVRRAAAFVMLAGMFTLLGAGVRHSVHGYRLVARNFYGQIRVQDAEESRKLFHGVINHGQQMLADENRRRTTADYCPGTGVELALREAAGEGPRRVGLLGLGCGTLAAYGREGDDFRLYEINPLVTDVADREFSFLRDSCARTTVVQGDARLKLEAEAAQGFDVLALDAFSGDSVPVHLLTKEAFATYFRHIRVGGILAIHITNRYLDLEPAVAAAVETYGKRALVFDYVPATREGPCYPATWMLVMERESPVPARFAGGRTPRSVPDFRTWTDDYSSLFAVLRPAK